ncbi:MAG: DUF1501 domain-containing protein [Armatimonadota bacterium]
MKPEPESMGRSPHVPRITSRRDLLFRAGLGLGGIALASLLADDAAASVPAGTRSARATHFAAKADSVIFLFMEGGPSHIDLFDPKPELQRLAGQPLPESYGRPATAMGVGGNALLPTKRTFKKHGQSGIDVSDWYPHIAEHADRLCVLRSCWADGINHVGSVCQMNTGSILAGRPSLGAWVQYGLGSVNRDLPGFVILLDDREPLGGAKNWSSGFMPATYQGTQFRPDGPPILNLAPPPTVSREQQRQKLDFLQTLNRRYGKGREDYSELEARVAAYELAFRMQAAATEAVDLSRETEGTRALYGMDQEHTRKFGQNCLQARRLVERGVRFVELYCGTGSQWDAHADLEGNHSRLCAVSDKPIAGLLTDLAQRGLLERTLVVWGGEFGRTPMSEKGNGRDHNPFGFTMFMAGGGVKPGFVHGRTDDLGLYAVDDRVHVHDLHATILHLLGMDHLRLTYHHNGRDERATVNGGTVVKKILA